MQERADERQSHPSGKPHTVLIGDGSPTRLDAPGGVKLRFAHRYKVVEAPEQPGTWKVSTTEYFYALDDSGDQEIIAYHWHPDSDVKFPHLHIGPGARAGRVELHKAHIPTGRVALEDLLRMAITEFGVEPHRDDWAEVLADTKPGQV